jgi:hypothetical protein
MKTKKKQRPPKGLKAWAVWFPEKNCYLGEGDALGIWFYSRKASMWELPRSMGGVWVQMFIRPNTGKVKA